MTKQRRATLAGAAVVSCLLMIVLLFVRGNSAPVAAPEVVPTAAEVTVSSVPAATPATPTTNPQTGVPATTDAPDFQETPDSSPPTSNAPFVLVLPDDVGAPSSTASTTTRPELETSATTTSTVAPPTVDESFAKSVLLQEGWAVFGTDASAPVLAAIGTPADDAVAAAIASLGEPTEDTGLVADDDCAGLRTRRLRFGGLELVLAEQVEGMVTFEQWYIDGPLNERNSSVDLVVEDGLQPGLTVEELLASNALLVVFQEDDGSGSFRMPGDDSNSPVWGRTSGGSAEDTVTAIWSGNECRRI